MYANPTGLRRRADAAKTATPLAPPPTLSIVCSLPSAVSATSDVNNLLAMRSTRRRDPRTADKLVDGCNVRACVRALRVVLCFCVVGTGVLLFVAVLAGWWGGLDGWPGPRRWPADRPTKWLRTCGRTRVNGYLARSSSSSSSSSAASFVARFFFFLALLAFFSISHHRS